MMSKSSKPRVSNNNCRRKVAVALSGGVDSSVAAALLVEQGYDCAGFHMHLWSEPDMHHSRSHGFSGSAGSACHLEGVFQNKCCSTEALESARKTCQKLNIPFYPIDFSEVFKEKIVDEFLGCYAKGLTPNPCVTCNKQIKFGKLLEYVLGLGFNYLATGHYCRVAAKFPPQADQPMAEKVSSEKPASPAGGLKVFSASQGNTFDGGRLIRLSRRSHDSSNGEGIGECFHLLTARDQKKDQTYFLYGLTQEKLAHVLFPVGDYLKTEVRGMAKKWDLPSAKKKDSMAICFFPEIDPRPFLKRHISEKIILGDVVSVGGRIIGQHDGLPLYTIGQRGGIRVDKKGFGGSIPPFYVVAKDVKNNQLVVGFGKETERKEFTVENVNFISKDPSASVGMTKISDTRGEPKLTPRVSGDINTPGVSLGSSGVNSYEKGLFVKIRSQGEMLPAKIVTDGENIKVVLDEGERGITPGQSCVIYKAIRGYGDTVLRSGNDVYEVIGGGIIV